ncbi:MAG: AAA family ATPase, partial [Prevotellaceae bacterium]|nr:AAA family ATPase [Prevotellaceae bacterium]
GKSLLISTLENYFLGRKELFQGLAIDSLEKEWAEYPVFHLDFNGKNFTSPLELKETIETFISKTEEKYGKDPLATTYGDRLSYVFEQAHEKTGRRVVVLIDEYDMPLLEVMNTGIPSPVVEGDVKTLEDYNRNILKGLYSVFKLADKHLRFVLLTGVTKFSQVSVFSGFNQPDDISYDGRYDALCGITKDELLTVFKEQIKELGKKNGMTEEGTIAELKRKYDGYHFSENMIDVFNPFSLLNCLQKGRFKDYWFSTGTPTYLMRLLSDNHENVNELVGKYYPAPEFVDYKATKQKPLPMLYQSGYLTIKGYNQRRNTYMLDFPNEEVRSGMTSALAGEYFGNESRPSTWLNDVSDSLEAGDLEKFKLQLTAFLANISYRFQRKQDAMECERHFQYTFYLIMCLLGRYNTYIEKETSQGRIDCILECPDYVYIFEFKLNSTAEVALKQIEEKNYALPYAADARKIYKVGISFSSETGTVNDFDYSPRL